MAPTPKVMNPPDLAPRRTPRRPDAYRPRLGEGDDHGLAPEVVTRLIAVPSVRAQAVADARARLADRPISSRELADAMVGRLVAERIR